MVFFNVLELVEVKVKVFEKNVVIVFINKFFIVWVKFWLEYVLIGEFEVFFDVIFDFFVFLD